MEKEIGKVKKNDSVDIVIRIDDFGGKPGLTIREYSNSERYTGFTKSGTRIPVDSFKEFKELINSIDEKEFLGSDEKVKENNLEKAEESEEDVSEEDIF